MRTALTLIAIAILGALLALVAVEMTTRYFGRLLCLIGRHRWFYRAGHYGRRWWQCSRCGRVG